MRTLLQQGYLISQEHFSDMMSMVIQFLFGLVLFNMGTNDVLPVVQQVRLVKLKPPLMQNCLLKSMEQALPYSPLQSNYFHRLNISI